MVANPISNINPQINNIPAPIEQAPPSKSVDKASLYAFNLISGQPHLRYAKN